jgi:hypothetical protein
MLHALPVLFSAVPIMNSSPLASLRVRVRSRMIHLRVHANEIADDAEAPPMIAGATFFYVVRDLSKEVFMRSGVAPSYNARLRKQAV